jgi:hypothetical protein
MRDGEVISGGTEMSVCTDISVGREKSGVTKCQAV